MQSTSSSNKAVIVTAFLTIIVLLIGLLSFFIKPIRRAYAAPIMHSVFCPCCGADITFGGDSTLSGEELKKAQQNAINEHYNSGNCLCSNPKHPHFKSTNYFNYAWLPGITSKNGITVINNNDGSYTLNGTSTARCVFYLVYKLPISYFKKSPYLPYKLYSSSYFCDGFFFYGDIYLNNSYYNSFNSGIDLDYVKNGYVDLYFSIDSNITLSDCKVYPYINIGQKYPYQPYNGYYQLGYQEGYNKAQEEIKQAGTLLPDLVGGAVSPILSTLRDIQIWGISLLDIIVGIGATMLIIIVVKVVMK